MEAHHRVNHPDTGRNSGGRRIIEKIRVEIHHALLSQISLLAEFFIGKESDKTKIAEF